MTSDGLRQHATTTDARSAWEEGRLEDHFNKPVSMCIVDDTISIEWPDSKGEKSVTSLRRTKGPQYAGKSVWASGTSKEETAIVEAVLYANETGYVLIGEETWPLSGIDWFTVQALKPVR